MATLIPKTRSFPDCSPNGLLEDGRHVVVARRVQLPATPRGHNADATHEGLPLHANSSPRWVAEKVSVVFAWMRFARGASRMCRTDSQHLIDYYGDDVPPKSAKEGEEGSGKKEEEGRIPCRSPLVVLVREQPGHRGVPSHEHGLPVCHLQ